MSTSLNKVMLIGHLGKDPEIRSFQNGGKAATLSLATSESWKDKTSGERKERTEWHRISITNSGLVGVVEKYLKKGARPVGVELSAGGFGSAGMAGVGTLWGRLRAFANLGRLIHAPKGPDRAATASILPVAAPFGAQAAAARANSRFTL